MTTEAVEGFNRPTTGILQMQLLRDVYLREYTNDIRMTFILIRDEMKAQPGEENTNPMDGRTWTDPDNGEAQSYLTD